MARNVKLKIKFDPEDDLEDQEGKIEGNSYIDVILENIRYVVTIDSYNLNATVNRSGKKIPIPGRVYRVKKEGKRTRGKNAHYIPLTTELIELNQRNRSLLEQIALEVERQ